MPGPFWDKFVNFTNEPVVHCDPPAVKKNSSGDDDNNNNNK